MAGSPPHRLLGGCACLLTVFVCTACMCCHEHTLRRKRTAPCVLPRQACRAVTRVTQQVTSPAQHLHSKCTAPAQHLHSTCTAPAQHLHSIRSMPSRTCWSSHCCADLYCQLHLVGCGSRMKRYSFVNHLSVKRPVPRCSHIPQRQV
jgi:hypothetical protein